jgi:Spy/CpxP family protein refolding chaperone
MQGKRRLVGRAAAVAGVLVAALSVETFAQGPGAGRRGFGQGGPRMQGRGPGGPGGPGAGGPGGRGIMMGGPMLPLGQLDLTESQQDQVQDVMEKAHPEMEATGKRVLAAREAQEKAVRAIPADENAIRAGADAMAAAMAEVGVLRARVRNDLWALLTPEQQTKAKQIKADMAARQEQRKDFRQQLRERRGQRRQRPQI